MYIVVIVIYFTTSLSVRAINCTFGPEGIIAYSRTSSIWLLDIEVRYRITTIALFIDETISFW